MRGTFEERFWAKVDKSGPVTDESLGACWIWTAGRTPNGYAKFWDGGECIGAHLISFKLAGRDLPDGERVAHRCGIKHCVNPNHLFIRVVPSEQEQYERMKETSRLWKERNRESANASSRERKRRERSEEGDRVRARERLRYWQNRERIRQQQNEKARQNPEWVLLTKAKERAAQRNLAISITEADIHIPDVCPLLGIPMFKGTGKAHDGSPTIDRIDQRGGYTPDNIWVISYRANRIKNDATVEEFLAIADALRRRLGL